jgi:hypothetical protein
MQKHLEALERIEKAFPTEKECEGTHGSAKGGASFKKKMVSFSEHIPKKITWMQSTASYASSMGEQK